MNATIESALKTSRSTVPSAKHLEILMEAEELIGQMSEVDFRELQRQLESQSRDGWLHLWHGLALEVNGRLEEACEAYERAIDLGCDHWRAGWYLARAAYKNGSAEWVDQACAAVLKVAPDFWFARELPKHARGYYAQLEQDRFIEEFFQSHPPRYRVFVEVGAFDGVHYSNVRRLHEVYGWTGVCIEPVKKNFRKLVQSYRHTSIKCVRAAVTQAEGQVEMNVSSYPHLPSWGSDVASLSDEGVKRWKDEFGAQWTRERVPAKRLTTILDEQGIRRFDLLSLDAEGHDLEVLQTSDFNRFSPQLIVVEYGNQRSQIQEFLSSRGFEVVSDNGQDLFLTQTQLTGTHARNTEENAAPILSVPARGMKIVGLVPARNEHERLEFCLRALAKYTDAIVYLDDCSDDNSLGVVESLAESCRIERVIRKTRWHRDEPGDRNALLAAGREIGGTYFIVLDADEVLTANLADDDYLRRLITRLRPGEKLAMTWIQLWRSVKKYRFDDSVWTWNSKAVIFCDDQKCHYDSGFIHTPRVPANLEGQTHFLPGYTHGLLHFQFVNWRNLLVKQAWYRCLERIRDPQKSARAIDELYAPSKDERNLRLKPAPENWLSGYSFFDPARADAPEHWREAQVLDWFEQYGRDCFKDLDIWDIDWGRPGPNSVSTVVCRDTESLSRAVTAVIGLDSSHAPSASASTVPGGEEPAPLVSAIVSACNSERFLRGCLEDLEAQTIADRLETIVIDSGSEQNERSIVEEFQRRHGNIVYLRTDEREGIYAAWNRGVQQAKGKYITNANTDDRHRADAFEIMARALDEHPVGLVYADALVTSYENETFDRNRANRILRWPDFSVRQLLMYSIFGPQPMWRRSVHEKIGYFDPAFVIAGDYEFFIRLAVEFHARHIPEVLGLYFDGGAEQRNQETCREETGRILKLYRSALPLDTIYPQLKETGNAVHHRRRALLD
ncbi:MAG: FkbM family methyltransferase, partial [Candidatus Omnitrophica bacterium]|nr:FkbM family methyltransferase [Candidatus Omnitrophota bacterium]